MDKVFGKPQPRLFADSGAYSASTTGVQVSIQKYVEWIRRWEHLFDQYANLDVIGDADATLVNQKRLEDAGVRPVPVFHVGESWEYLERYLDEYPLVALGGMVPHTRRMTKIFPWLIKAFRMLPKGKGYHGFGITGWRAMASFPWQSVDSSSWGAGYMYGTARYFDKRAGTFAEFSIMDKAETWGHRRQLENLGFNWKDFIDRTDKPLFGAKSKLRKVLCALSARGYLDAEEWLTRRHGHSCVYLAHPLASTAGGYEGLRKGEALHSGKYNGEWNGNREE